MGAGGAFRSCFVSAHLPASWGWGEGAHGEGGGRPWGRSRSPGPWGEAPRGSGPGLGGGSWLGPALKLARAAPGASRDRWARARSTFGARRGGRRGAAQGASPPAGGPGLPGGGGRFLMDFSLNNKFSFSFSTNNTHGSLAAKAAMLAGMVPGWSCWWAPRRRAPPPRPMNSHTGRAGARGWRGSLRRRGSTAGLESARRSG